jgi:RNA polymerase sigma factor (sigma-70 family)
MRREAHSQTASELLSVAAIAPSLSQGLAREARNALAAGMTSPSSISGLQRVLADERPRLLRFLAARGAVDDAEDVLQDLWHKISGAEARPVSDPVSYLFRAAENVLRDRQRANLSRGRRQHEWQDLAASDHAPQGERVLIARERLREAESTLLALGPRVDQVFRRYRLEGLGQAAIARELGISLSSVEKDLQKAYRALAQLKDKFDAE